MTSQRKTWAYLCLLAAVAMLIVWGGLRKVCSQTPAAAPNYPEYRFNPHVPMLNGIQQTRKDPWLWIENDHVKVGLNLDYGGAVCWISKAGSDFNLVNWHDPGRQVQTSYFGGDNYPVSGSGYRFWKWNPTQAGDVRGNRSPVIAFKEEKNHLWVRCQPLNWEAMESAVSLRGKSDPGPAPAEAFIDVDATLDGPVVKLTFGLTYWGTESHGLCNFEMPAIYTVAPLTRYWTYTGNHPWTNEPAEDLSDKVPPNMTIKQFEHKATEQWGAWLTPQGFGLTAYQPDATTFSAGTFYPPGTVNLDAPRDAHWGREDGCHYVGGFRRLPIDQWHCRYEWDLYLMVGELEETRRIITQKLRDVPKMRANGPASTN